MSRYQVIFFCPHPGRGWRIPVAAVAETGARNVELVVARQTPDASCAGGVAEQFLLQRGTDVLRSARLTLGELPMALTDHFVLGVSMEAPREVTNVAKWIELQVLPVPASSNPSQRRNFQRRKTVGRSFLRAQSVDEYVGDDFDIGEQFEELADFRGLDVKATHWVRTNDDKRLLLEPISSANDVRKQVTTILHRYGTMLRLAENTAAADRLFPYVYLISTDDGSREEMLRRVGKLEVVSKIVDTQNAEDSRAFVEMIRSRGVSFDEQPRLN